MSILNVCKTLRTTTTIQNWNAIKESCVFKSQITFNNPTVWDVQHYLLVKIYSKAKKIM